MISRLTTIILIAFTAVCLAQEQTPAAATDTAPVAPAAPAPKLKLHDFETAVILKLREQFPRLPPYFTTAHSCHLPDYGPMVSVMIQPPSTFFVRPVLWQLEQKQKTAEEQTRRVQEQIERMAQLIRLRAREADLVGKISIEEASRKKSTPYMDALQKDLTDTRKSLQDLETLSLNFANTGEDTFVLSVDQISEIDLDKMIRQNYEDLVGKVTDAMIGVLVEKASDLDLNDKERVSISTSIRDNYLGNPDQNLLFILNPEDIHAFRNGTLDAKALRTHIIIQHEKSE